GREGVEPRVGGNRPCVPGLGHEEYEPVDELPPGRVPVQVVLLGFARGERLHVVEQLLDSGEGPPPRGDWFARAVADVALLVRLPWVLVLGELRDHEEEAALAAVRNPRTPVALPIALDAMHDEHNWAVRAEVVGAVRPHPELVLRSLGVRC